MLFESFALKIAQIMGIPPGASLRKNYGAPGNGQKNTTSVAAQNDYIQAIVTITVDDICIGDTPLSVAYRDDTPKQEIAKLQVINDAFNVIVKWVAKDLCLVGHSVYSTVLRNNNKDICFIPYIQPVTFYLTKDNTVVAFDEKGQQLVDKLIYINFDKDSLVEIEDTKMKSDKLLYQVNPMPMQLRNADNAVTGLTNAETSLTKLRMQYSRVPRWVNVDIGTASGDNQDAVIETISSSINANSTSLNSQTAYSDFDDNIPVLPNRKGLGKPELVEANVNPNIKDLADVDYWLSKLNLIMRFPASYVDFSKSLDATTVSLLRGDIRYQKMVSSVQSKIVSTNNKYVNDSNFSKWEPSFYLTRIPSSEDADVIEALSTYTDLCSSVEDYIGGAETIDLKLHRLQLLQDLLSSSTTSPALQKWFEDYREMLTVMASKESEEPEEMPDEFTEPIEVDIPEEPELGPPSPVEAIPPSTE